LLTIAEKVLAGDITPLDGKFKQAFFAVRIVAGPEGAGSPEDPAGIAGHFSLK
jgi:hypothetical protein